ncbi:MAG: PrpR N-terminal domain-containing protein [Clostridia bacterium]|nr:PrpR N-terminal domain-containing protein [Clostridia bacterium]
MNKLLIVMPNRLLYDAARDIVSQAGVEAEVIQTTSDHVVEVVRRAMEGCTGVVVARGNQAQILKRCGDFQVMEIIFSGQEMAHFLTLARDQVLHAQPRIAFVGFHHMYSDIDSLGQLANADVNIYYTGSSAQVIPTVDKAVADGAEVIIGSENACNYAQSIGVKTVFVDGSYECIRDVLRKALFVVNAMRIEQRKTAEFTSLLNYSFDAILKLSLDGTIEIANFVAEKAFQCTAAELIGKRFTELPRLELSDAVYEALEQRKNLYSHVVRIRNERYLMNIACIDAAGQALGFILSLYAFGSVDDLEERIRQERIQQGHTARRKFKDFTAKSPRMRMLLADAAMYAQYDLPLLITGETGTEKTRLAECIHNASLRKKNPFVQADLSVLPLSSQTELLFGRAKTNGIVYQAHQGTLYIRHVHLLTKESQHQLLNLIRYEQYYGSGQHMPTWASVRVICSTDEDLMALARQEQFLYPLAQKLTDYELRLPPLRECPEDIADLIAANMTFAHAHTRKQAAFTPDALELLMHFPWHGNHREMSIFCEKAFLLARGSRIDADFLAQHLLKAEEQPDEKAPLLVVSSEEERNLRAALAEHHGDKAAVMAALGISRSTLYRRMKKYGLDVD